MIIMHVFVQVKPEHVEAFRAATIENASNSVQEPGIARFDVIQQQDDPTRFVLVEVYRTAEAPARHKETAHYQKWLDTVDGDDGQSPNQDLLQQRLPGRCGLVRTSCVSNLPRQPGFSLAPGRCVRSLRQWPVWGGGCWWSPGAQLDRAQALLDHLESLKVVAVTFPVSGEPTLDRVRSGVQEAREGACEAVIGFGGGSVIDAGKAIAALLTNRGNLLDYLEVIGQGQPLTQAPVPYVAVPTTAGTGAEVTRNAVLTSPDHRVKVSLRSPMMLPRLAVVDSELTHSLPAHLTASTGLDALTQLIEPYVCNSPNPITDALCREGMREQPEPCGACIGRE